jgi:hypothetical protein
VGERVARALFEKAIRGDVRAIAELLDRAEGRPRQSMEVAAVESMNVTHNLCSKKSAHG